MNYRKIYELIIKKAKSENRVKHNGVYYENHHINPRSLGGENEKDNLVLLTAKEHFICHKLLIKIYPCRQMALALHKMTYGNNDYKNTSRDYAYAREIISEIGLLEETKRKISESNKGRKLTEEHKQNISESNKGRNLTEEHKKNLSRSLYGNTNKKGTKLNIEGKRNISLSRIGEKNWNYGKTRSEETKNKISNANTGKKRSEESKLKMSNSRKGKIPWNKGMTGLYKHSDESKRKISESFRIRREKK